MFRYLITAGFALLPVCSTASSSAAWRQLEQQAGRACIAASSFRAPRLSSMVVFDDRTGFVALLVTGVYRQPRLNGATGTNLCLYDRRTRKVVVEEARGWREAP